MHEISCFMMFYEDSMTLKRPGAGSMFMFPFGVHPEPLRRRVFTIPIPHAEARGAGETQIDLI